MFTAGVSGPGITYYVKPSAPSVYFMAAAGLGDYNARFAINVEVDVGPAYLVGIGYEISSHKMIEATMLAVDVENVISDSSINSLQITYNYVWY